VLGYSKEGFFVQHFEELLVLAVFWVIGCTEVGKFVRITKAFGVQEPWYCVKKLVSFAAFVYCRFRGFLLYIFHGTC
jgi:hypothetical protein